MEKRTLKYGTNYVVLTIIAIGIIAIINGISARHFIRFDLTENKEFTISKASHEIAEKLDDLITVKVYFSKELPPYLLNLENQVRDILGEYSAFAHGKMNVDWVRPANDEKTEQEMGRLGIPKLQLNIIAKDKQELTTAYLGMVLMFEDRKEVIPVVKNIGNLEYDFTSAMLKVMSKDAKAIGIYTNQPPKDPRAQNQDEYSTLRENLQKSFAVRDVNMTNGAPVPKDVTSLLVISPENVPDRDKYEIDQFIMRGGKALFMINPIKLASGGLTAEVLKTNMQDSLAFYGVKLSNDLVCDARNANASFNSGFVRFMLPYPFWPKITKQYMSADNPIVSDLESLVFPWCGHIKLIDENIKDKKLTRLAFSSDRSWLIHEGSGYNLNPQQKFNPDQADVASYPLAVVLNGTFDSFYKGKAAPEAAQPPANPEQPAPPKPPQPATVEKSPETNLAFIANSNFLQDQFLQLFPQNLTFMLNLVDWVTIGDQLIGIRSRNVAERPLAELSDSSKTAIKVINLIGVSLLVVAFGLVRFVLARHRRRLITQGVL